MRRFCRECELCGGFECKGFLFGPDLIRAADGQLRSLPTSHRHASESWHPAFVAAHADRKRDPSFRWGDGRDDEMAGIAGMVGE
jgi:hypothetical protein